MHDPRREELLTTDESGLRCGRGDFWIDPWRPVPVAVITHAHGDHARPGSGSYLAPEAGLPLLRRRLPGESIRGVPWGEPVRIGETTISFHPAGHVRGSAQVRIESAGETWVVSGDYKRQTDPTCEPFETVPCDVFVTETTFGLPIFRWPDPATVAAEIAAWWRANAAAGRASLLFCYALGKAQRLLAELAAQVDRTVWLHGALVGLVEAYRDDGVPMLPTRPVAEREGGSWAGELVLAPPSARRSPWMRRFGAAETAFASGWMRLRRHRRGRGVDRGFELSDHADWPALLRTVEQTGARRVLTTHGYAEPFARVLRERGLAAAALPTPWRDEEED